MIIVLDIPEWALGRNLTFFAGKELLAYSPFHDKEGYILNVKTGRCNGCGHCCENLGSPFSMKQHEEIKKRFNENVFQEFGRCPLLGDKGCILGRELPLGCAQSDCSRFSPCTESFEQIGGVISG